MKLTANIQGCGLGWVDLDFEYSTVCLILLGPNQSQPNPTKVHEQINYPVLIRRNILRRSEIAQKMI